MAQPEGRSRTHARPVGRGTEDVHGLAGDGQRTLDVVARLDVGRRHAASLRPRLDHPRAVADLDRQEAGPDREQHLVPARSEAPDQRRPRSRPPRRPHVSCRSAGRGRPGRAPPTTRRSHALRDDERRSPASRGSVVVGSVIAHLPESGTGAGQVPDIGGVDPPDQGGGEAGQLGCRPFVHAGVGVDLSSDGDPGFVGRPGRRCTIDHREPPTGDTYVRPSARITTPRATSTTAKTTSPHRPRARATIGRAATAWPARQHGATSTRNTVA